MREFPCAGRIRISSGVHDRVVQRPADPPPGLKLGPFRAGNLGLHLILGLKAEAMLLHGFAGL